MEKEKSRALPDWNMPAPGELTFLANTKYAPKVKDTRASAILTAEPLRDLAIASLVSANPYLDFARALALFYQPPKGSARHSPAGVHCGHGADW